MTMTEEINEVFLLHIPKPNFVCKVHEENQSCIKMFTGTNIYSIKNHIALKYHHFITHAKYVWVEIQYILTHEQLANIQTKLFSNKDFFTLRYMLCGLGYAPNKPISDQLHILFQKYGCFVTRKYNYAGLIFLVLYIMDSQLALLSYNGVSHTSTSSNVLSAQ